MAISRLAASLLMMGAASIIRVVGMSTAPAVDPMFAGCGEKDLADSVEYGQINEKMHNGMAINFTDFAHYDFIAAMIPHHAGASEMCDVWNKTTLARSNLEPSHADYFARNSGIASLCFNITYGAVKWGKWQYDFSQPGETEQMENVLKNLTMFEHYKQGCKAIDTCEEKAPLVLLNRNTWKTYENMTDCVCTAKAMGMSEGTHDSHHRGISHDMYMGCGNLKTPQSREYLKLNMKMHMQMALNWTGNPDIDFLRGMIPHHEAAIDMCAIYYKYWPCTKDPAYPVTELCHHPTIPSEEMLTKLGAKKYNEIEVSQYMYHICSQHILVTQLPEVAWMTTELERILGYDPTTELAVVNHCKTPMTMNMSTKSDTKMENISSHMSHGSMHTTTTSVSNVTFDWDNKSVTCSDPSKKTISSGSTTSLMDHSGHESTDHSDHGSMDHSGHSGMNHDSSGSTDHSESMNQSGHSNMSGMGGKTGLTGSAGTSSSTSTIEARTKIYKVTIETKGKYDFPAGTTGNQICDSTAFKTSTLKGMAKVVNVAESKVKVGKCAASAGRRLHERTLLEESQIQSSRRETSSNPYLRKPRRLTTMKFDVTLDFEIETTDVTTQNTVSAKLEEANVAESIKTETATALNTADFSGDIITKTAGFTFVMATPTLTAPTKSEVVVTSTTTTSTTTIAVSSHAVSKMSTINISALLTVCFGMMIFL